MKLVITIFHCEAILFKSLEMPGFEPGASYMRSKRSTAELHPQSWNEGG